MQQKTLQPRTVRLPPELWHDLDNLAYLHRRSTNGMIWHIVEEALRKDCARVDAIACGEKDVRDDGEWLTRPPIEGTRGTTGLASGARRGERKFDMWGEGPDGAGGL